jgi:prevent-host-death family protein
MKTVGAFEAKTRLSELLVEVAAGAEILITRRGMPTAILSPARGRSVEGVRNAVNRILSRRGLRLRGTTLRALIDAGRKL